MLYDKNIYGLFGRELKIIRAHAGAALGLLGPRRSLDLGLAFHPSKDPEVTTAAAVLKRFLQECWLAALPPQFRDPCCVPLGVIASGVSAFLKGPSAHQVAGPLSATARVLMYVGWSFEGPMCIKTNTGTVFNTTTVCPKRIVHAFSQRYQEVILGRAARKLHARLGTTETAALVDRGIFFEPLLSLKRNLPAKQGRALVNIVANGVITATSLIDMGFDYPPECKKCSAGLDNVFHRCFTCEHAEDKAAPAFRDNDFNAIICRDWGVLATSRCLFPKPVVNFAPVEESIIEFVNLGAGDWFDPKDGEVFSDGSCFHPTTPALSHAGAAVVQVDSAGEVFRAVLVTIARSLPQTPLCAEYAGLSAAFDTCRGCALVMDCQAVITAWNHGMDQALKGFSGFECFWKAILRRNPDPSKSVRNIHKTKAHRSLDDIASDDTVEIARFYGNKAADDLAKEAASKHGLDIADSKAYLALDSRVKNVARHMSDIIASEPFHFYRIPHVTRLPRGAMIAKSSEASHDWTWIGRRWVCRKCMMRTLTPSSLAPNRVVCKADSPTLFDYVQKPNGHRLWMTDMFGGGHLVYCPRCRCYAESVARRLKERCRGSTVNICGKRSFGGAAKKQF